MKWPLTSLSSQSPSAGQKRRHSGDPLRDRRSLPQPERLLMRLISIVAVSLLMGTAAHASSDDAWAAFTLAVAEKCAASSGLKHAHVSELVGFDDSLGKVATLVTGVFPQKALKGAKGKMLCIYDKQTRKVWIDEAKGWSAPDLR